MRRLWRLVRPLIREPYSELRYAWSARGLPPRVWWFTVRARLLMTLTRDRLSYMSATRATDLQGMLELARGRRTVVELGTGPGWTALSLALDDPARVVVTYDVVAHPEVARYTRLCRPDVLGRVEFRVEPGNSGPSTDRPVDLLYIDSSHEHVATVEEFRAWEPVLSSGAIVVFDDYGISDYPGVRAAVEELGLSGVSTGGQFIYRHT